jgi:hypothetical protein
MLKRLRKRHLEKKEGNNNSEKLGEKKLKKIPYNELLKEGFFAGVGWAFGVTVGFVVISTLIVFVLNYLGGLPLIGSWIADIVEETQNQLMRRTPVFQ